MSIKDHNEEANELTGLDWTNAGSKVFLAQMVCHLARELEKKKLNSEKAAKLLEDRKKELFGTRLSSATKEKRVVRVIGFIVTILVGFGVLFCSASDTQNVGFVFLGSAFLLLLLSLFI